MTDQVVLRPVSAALAQRIVAHLPDDDETWAADFPGEADVMAATMFLLLSQVYGDLGPFGCYTIERERRVVGTISFKGAPHEGSVEVGYHLVPSARGTGLASQALQALLALAWRHQVQRVVATTAVDNHASRRTLENAGLRHVTCEQDECTYEILRDPKEQRPRMVL